MRKQIGVVEVTRRRVYPLDPVAPRYDEPDYSPLKTEVVVEPGEYPVYEDGISRYWRMTGFLNHGLHQIGDGMIAFHGGDDPSDDDAIVYSRRYGPDEWAELMVGFRTPNSALVFTLEPDELGSESTEA